MRSLQDTSVRVRIDKETKEKATRSLTKMGLSLSEAVRLLLVRIAEEGRIPFAVEVPNAKTRRAMEELETGGGVARSTVDEAFKELGL